MGKISRHPPVKLVIGLIAAKEVLFDTAIVTLRKKFGPIDLESPVIDFNLTGYYQEEFGAGLKRKFLSFKKLICPEKLAGIKCATNAIEHTLAEGPRRRVNIDPGYLDLAKLVLASTKNFYHRIPIGRGIYAEVTLAYQNKEYRFFEWTYPDYRSPAYAEFFKKTRILYQDQLK